MPSISVITPAHIDSQEKLGWLREAIQSVVNQTFTDWEMIIVDDESPVDIMPTVSGNDDRIRCVRAGHRQGPSACRNTGVAIALSEGVLGLDADDQLPEDALGAMYEAWQNDKTRIVYGDLQRLELREDGQFHLGRVFNLGDYTFDGVMDLNGIIPVTALHSKECHERAGGWKMELDAGLEDVEKWIAAGKAGFCGFKVQQITLYYRQHQQSRAYAMRVTDRRMPEMRKLIQEMHADIYMRGERPMGCCGGSGVATPAPRPATGNAPRPNTLDQYPSSEKQWLRYNGKRRAAFGANGQFTGIRYQIRGTGYEFPVHTNDLSVFRRSGRGKDFTLIPPPEDAVSSEPQQEAPAYEAPSPQLATIERLDTAAEQAGVVTAQGQPISAPQPPPIIPEPEPEAGLPAGENYDLGVMGLGALEGVLETEGWNVLKLAEAEPDELIPYKGIGPVRAGKIIAQAREILGWERTA